ncbi:MAG TPA: hypothetical protein VFP84_33035 [Kofleriaceae bacterium]|nr:hypothetical protein [Kofleriaceae bacterium]
MARPATRRIWRWAGGVLGLAFAIMLVVHLPPVRGWLAARGHHGGGVCPLGYGTGQVADRATRRAHDDAWRGALPALARPALGFTLDVTTRADIERWARANGVACHAMNGGVRIACVDVPAAALADGGLAASSVWLDLDDRGALIAVTTVRRDPDVRPVASAFAAVEHAVTTRAGAPTTRAGSAAPDVLGHGALRQAMVEYRFTTYRAVVRATHVGDAFVLTEQYVALAD